MGLDQYAQGLDKEFYWRKHARLQEFMSREHAKQNLKISLNKWQLFISIIAMIINKLFKTNFNNPASIAFDNINKIFTCYLIIS